MTMARQGLNTDRVLDAASVIADSEGLDEVTLARVAQQLGVRAPSLYNHVEGRQGLLRLLTIRALRELTERMRDAAVGRSGPEALSAVAHAYRAFARQRPGLYATTVAAPLSEDRELGALTGRTVDLLVAVLAGWRLEGDRALHHVRVIRSGLHGFVMIEAAGGFGLPLDLDTSFTLLLETLIAGLERARVASES